MVNGTLDVGDDPGIVNFRLPCRQFRVDREDSITTAGSSFVRCIFYIPGGWTGVTSMSVRSRYNTVLYKVVRSVNVG